MNIILVKLLEKHGWRFNSYLTKTPCGARSGADLT